jgi:hypothetical protein
LTVRGIIESIFLPDIGTMEDQVSVGDSLDQAITAMSSALEALRAEFNRNEEPTLRKTERLKELMKAFEISERIYNEELRKIW